MAHIEQTPEVAKIITRMTRFASYAKSDRVSVAVARAAERLAKSSVPNEPPLTVSEMRIIRMFKKDAKAA